MSNSTADTKLARFSICAWRVAGGSSRRRQTQPRGGCRAKRSKKGVFRKTRLTHPHPNSIPARRIASCFHPQQTLPIARSRPHRRDHRAWRKPREPAPRLRARLLFASTAFHPSIYPDRSSRPHRRDRAIHLLTSRLDVCVRRGQTCSREAPRLKVDQKDTAHTLATHELMTWRTCRDRPLRPRWPRESECILFVFGVWQMDGSGCDKDGKGRDGQDRPELVFRAGRCVSANA